MNTKQHRECYGKMFPDFDHLKYNSITEGKVFRVFVENIGAGRQRRELTANLDQWDECNECPEQHACYELGMARVAIAGALARS